MFDYLQANIVQIFAVVGALYALARTIVALTPTPKDDEVVGKVWVVVQKLGKLFGLDLSQGVQNDKKGSSGTNKAGLLILFLVLSCVVGCSNPGLSFSPQAQLLVAQKTFAAVVRGLADLQISGAFEPEETQALTVLIHEGQQQLSLWEVRLTTGQPTPQSQIQEFDNLILKLIGYEMRVKGGDS